MEKLEELKREIQDMWLDEIDQPQTHAGYGHTLDEIVAHIYSQAIQDAIGALPAKYLEAAVNPHSLHLKQVRNKVLEEAITSLTSLLPQQ